MDGAQGRAQAALAAMSGAALLGLAPIGMRLSELGPQATNFWRFVFALPILAVLAVSTPQPSRRELGWLLVAGLLFGLDLALWGAALEKTTVANATLLANMTPVVAAGFGWLVFKERHGARTLGGGAAALAGALLLSLGRAQAGEGPASASEGWVGDGLGLAAAFGYAGYLLIVRALGVRVSVGAVMFWASLSGGVFALSVSLLLGEALLPRTLQGWAILVGLGVVVQAGAQGLIAYGVGRLPIVVSTVLLWMQPLAAALLSWIIFAERLGPMALAGAALILAGLYVVQQARVRITP